MTDFPIDRARRLVKIARACERAADELDTLALGDERRPVMDHAREMRDDLREFAYHRRDHAAELRAEYREASSVDADTFEAPADGGDEA